jgi:SAM-dependent methyltransferase
MTTPADRDYVLGTHDAEVARLGIQHRVWRPRVLDVWRRAGLAPGHTVIDLGCGPGYATLDLAEVVGPSGRVHAFDRSSRFLGVLSAEAARRSLGQITTFELDLDDAAWPDVTADMVWCRWVAAFVRQPQAFVTRLRKLIRPGGRVVMHEYVDYATWSLMPDSPSFESFVTTVIATWRQAGGEPDIGRSLPMWLEEAGFRIDARPIVDLVGPEDAMWQWPRAFVEVGLERLVSIGAMTHADAAATWQEFVAREATPGIRMVNPTVLEIVGTWPY